MFDLALRPTVINGNRLKNVDAVIWRSYFGPRRVGRIYLGESTAAQTWVYHLQADIPAPPWCSGRSDSLEAAQAKFRDVFARFCEDAGDL
jgi:hypothetical protein